MQRHACMIDASKLFPVPMLWWGFFLGEPQSLTETHRWVTGVTRAWNSDTKKAAANIACQWSRATCTHGTVLGLSSSGVAIAIRPGPQDAQSIQWVTYSLNTYLPHPKPSPHTNRNQQLHKYSQNQQWLTMQCCTRQAKVLAQDVICTAVE
jgi:hypothetical protein